MDGFGRGKGHAAAIAAAIYTRVAPEVRGVREKKDEYEELFESSPTQQLAYRTILGQVQRYVLRWHGGGRVLEDVPVPPWWNTFVSDVVRAMLIEGVAFYRAYRVKEMVVCEVAPVGVVRPRWNKRKRMFEPDRGGWKMVVFEAPLHGADGGVTLRSSARRARENTRRLMALQENWHARDEFNSVPSVYTTVSSELASQNGSERMWFKNVTNGDVLQTRAVDIDSNFASLVHKRAETIQKLDAITSLQRGRGKRISRGKPGGKPQTHRGEAEEADHKEFIVSDGRQYTESRGLTSLADTKIMMDDLMHGVFWAYGVPPQALGKNINSERLASSNRLTEMAIQSFELMIERMRELVGGVLRQETDTGKSYLAFAVVLGGHELNELMGCLKTEKVIELMARQRGVPRDWFDEEGVKRMQIEGGQGGKRPRTEEETVAVLRKKAREERN